MHALLMTRLLRPTIVRFPRRHSWIAASCLLTLCFTQSVGDTLTIPFIGGTSRVFGEEAARNRLDPAEQDVVVIRGNRGEPRRLSGTVVDCSGEGLLLRPRTGPERTIPVEQVVKVETTRQAEFLQALDAKSAGRIEEALVHLQNAIKAETRPWVQREIAAEMVRALQAAGNHRAACELFLKIVSQDPQTPHLDCMPLAWSADQQSPDVVAAARNWLQAPQPAAQLLGASYLLLGSNGSEATAELRTLSAGQSGDSRIVLLATAQLWRSQIFTAVPEDIERWEVAAERLPLSFRAGPYYVIASAWSRHRRYDRAATVLLQAGLLCENPRPLVARCWWEAAENLARSGQEEDATRADSLRQGLKRRFPESPWAMQVD